MHSYVRGGEMYSLKEKENCNHPGHLGESEVLATRRHGGVESLLEGFVVFVLRKIELCETVST